MLLQNYRDVSIKSITATQANHTGISGTKNYNYIDKPCRPYKFPNRQIPNASILSKRAGKIPMQAMKIALHPQRPKLQKQICHTCELHGNKSIQNTGKLHKHQQFEKWLPRMQSPQTVISNYQ